MFDFFLVPFRVANASSLVSSHPQRVRRRAETAAARAARPEACAGRRSGGSGDMVGFVRRTKPLIGK